MSTGLSFRQVYSMSKLMFAPFIEWDAYKNGYISEDGTVIDSNNLTWQEIFIRNIKLLIVKYSIIKGRRGQNIFDNNIYRVIWFLREAKEELPIHDRILNEKDFLEMSFSKELEKLIENIPN